MNSFDRIWMYYFDLEYDSVLTELEEFQRRVYELAFKLVQKYYPGYSIHRIAAFLRRQLAENEGFKVSRSDRQCITYVQEAIRLFGEPIEEDKEFKRKLYIGRLLALAAKAENAKDFNAAIKANEKAAALEDFNQDADERIREILKKQEAKEVVFASSKEQLETLIAERRKKYLEQAEEAELADDDGE